MSRFPQAMLKGKQEAQSVEATWDGRVFKRCKNKQARETSREKQKPETET